MMTTKIRIGQCWMVRFTKQDIAVRLEEEREGGWIARVLSHGRKVVVKNRDIQTNGTKSRFQKKERGKFSLR